MNEANFLLKIIETNSLYFQQEEILQVDVKIWVFFVSLIKNFESHVKPTLQTA